MKEVYKRVLALILSSLLPGLISSSPVLSSLFLLLRAILGLLLLHRLSLPTPRCRKRILRSGLQLVKHFSKGGGGGGLPLPPRLEDGASRGGGSRAPTRNPRSRRLLLLLSRNAGLQASDLLKIAGRRKSASDSAHFSYFFHLHSLGVSGVKRSSSQSFSISILCVPFFPPLFIVSFLLLGGERVALLSLPWPGKRVSYPTKHGPHWRPERVEVSSCCTGQYNFTLSSDARPQMKEWGK